MNSKADYKSHRQKTAMVGVDVEILSYLDEFMTLETRLQ